MRIPVLSTHPAQGQQVQLSLPSDEQQRLELAPGDRIEGQVLRMVDNQATLQIGDRVFTARSSAPLAPGSIVLRVEGQVEGEWRLRIVGNEPPLYLVQEQLIDLRLNPDASREMLMRALLGQVPLDRQTFLLAEQLWKAVERQPEWLPALTQLFKNGGEISEAALHHLGKAMEQSTAPGWLQSKAVEAAVQLLDSWGFEETPQRLALLTAILETAPDLAEPDFSPQRWAAAWGQRESLPEGATRQTRSEASAANVEGARQSVSSSTAAAMPQEAMPQAGQNAPEDPGMPFASGASTLAETAQKSGVAARFASLEQLWSDLGYDREVLSELSRLFYSDQAVQGEALLSRLAELESRARFAALKFSEAEMGDKRALLQQMGLAERPERLVMLQRLNRGTHRAHREELLRAEQLWRRLGGRDEYLESSVRVVVERLPTEPSSVWAVRLAQEYRIQEPIVYLWLNLASAEPSLQSYVIHPDGEEQSAHPRNEERPLILLGFRTERLGPALLRVTPRGESYQMQLTVHELWRRRVEQQAWQDLVPQLKAILPRVQWQVQGLKELTQIKDAERDSSHRAKRRFDFRV